MSVILFGAPSEAELVRLVLHYYGVGFQEKPMNSELRLEIDGVTLEGATAVARYQCQQYGAYPSDPYEVYQVETLTRLREQVFAAVRQWLDPEDAQALCTWFSSHERILRQVEKRLLNNSCHSYFVGRTVSLADFALFELGSRCFTRPGRELESLLRDHAPTYHHFLRHFPASSPTLHAYIKSRTA